jgi:transposase
MLLGKVILRKKLSRNKFAPFIAQLSRGVIGMEACGGSPHWARKFAAYGHEVRLISPQFVKPFVKTNKTDRADAEALWEAVQRPTMRFVPIKSVEQQDLQALPRVRERLGKHRTALSNEIRGLLQEYGLVLPKKIHVLKQYLQTQLGPDEGELTPQGIELLRSLQQELDQLEAQLEG